MNKSKFLKKSLAMLLALMLVLAMIPLSASAAQTDYINYLYVNGQNAAVDGDGYSVTVGTPKVSLNANLKENVKLYYLDGEGEEQAIPSTIINLALDGYTSGSDDVYEMTIIAKVKETPDVSDAVTEYTYPLTITVDESANSDDTALQGLAAGADTWTYMTDWSVDNETHNVTVNLKFGANHPTLKANGGTLDDDDFEPVNSEAEVTVIDANTITVTAGTESRTEYKVTYVNEPAFESFEIPRQLGETEFVYNGYNGNEIKVTAPYGYDLTKVIASFTMVDGYELYEDSNQQNPMVSDVTEKNYSTAKTQIWVYDADGRVAPVYVTITAISKNPAGDLLTVKVEDSKGKASNTTEVTANTPTNSVMMPVDATIGGTENYTVTLTYSKGATVTVSSKNNNNTVVTGGTATADPLVYTATVNGLQLDEGNSFSVTVKSEDGEVTNVYNINLDQEATAEAELTRVVLKDKDTNTLYEAKIDPDKHEVVLTVPYSWRNTSGLDNVAIYMFASTGAEITHSVTGGKWTEAMNGDVASNSLKVNAGSVNGSWFPYPGSNTKTEVVVTNEPDNDEVVKNTYTIKIETETAKGGRTIESLNFSDQATTKTITDDNTFSAEVGSAIYDNGSTNGQKMNTIKVTVPYSWKGNTVYLYNLTMSDGAKLYSTGDNWATNYNYYEEHPVNNIGQLTFDLTTTGKFDAVTDGEIDTTKAIPVRVLSEANAVNATETPNNEITNALTTGSKLYTEYWIYFVKAPAETGAELLSIESTVDKNVTATLEGRTITINVPYTYDDDNQFSLNFETSKLATAYATYDSTDNTFDDQLNSDYGSEDTVGRTMFKVGTTYTELYTGSTQITKDGVGKIWVRAEDEVTAKAYDVKLVVNKIETGADVTSLSVNGTAATIARDQITVRLPLGTKLYPVTLDIEASKMAAVYVSPTSVSNPINDTYKYDPEARYDVNRPVKITVVAEDGKTSKIYTLNAIVESSFNDVTTDWWYYDEVMTAANKGWINGMRPGYFEPNGTMTRGQFATIIARILNYNPDNYPNTAFPDVPSDIYYSEAVAFCKENNIIDGDDKGNFNGEDPITREQMAKILCQALQLKVTVPEDKFDDDAKIAEWAKGYVYACQEAGIMEGDNGSFRPTDNATRAEGAAVLVRAFA